jgi:hypothetical protein
MKTLAAVLLVALAGSPLASALPPTAQAANDTTGSYALVSVNGDKVPATLTVDDVTLTIRGGTFVIHADGTCISRMSFVVPSGQEMNREVSGTYTRDGSKLTIAWTGAGMTTGTVDGKTFTMENEGMVLAYRK